MPLDGTVPAECDPAGQERRRSTSSRASRFHPLFGAMPKTPLMMEFQITQEYLGQRHPPGLSGPLCEEVLEADTYAARARVTGVASVIDGILHGHA